MNTVVVNLFAGPGAGKSTLAAGLFHALKMDGINCELVTEFAKDLTWEERHGAIACQPYVFGKQLKNLERVIGKVDVVVTDSPLLLSVVYCDTVEWGRDFTDAVVDIFRRRYHNLNYFINRSKPYNPVGRNQTFKEAERLDYVINGLLGSLGIRYTGVSGDITLNIEALKEDIKDEFSRIN